MPSIIHSHFKMNAVIDGGLQKFVTLSRHPPPPFTDLLDFIALNLNLDIGVHAIGPEKVVTMWSPGVHQGVSKVVLKSWIFNYFLDSKARFEMILEHSNKNIICKKS